MAWNQPGKGNQDPWKPRSNGNPVEDFLARLKDQLGSGGKGGSSGGFGPLGLVAMALGVLVLFNSFKLVDERELGVVLRFGAFDRIMTPGANFKLPWPIESAYVIDAQKIETLEDTVRVLTKDENIVDIKLNAQYRVSNPRLFLFGFRDDIVSGSQQGTESMRHAAESAVREVVGNNTMDTVLFDRDQLRTSAQKHLQDSLDLYQTGLTVTQFNLQDARPPEEVKKAFDEAISAREKKNSIVNEARAYASKIVPEARGVAARIKAESEGYRAAAIARATGDADRFSQLVVQYRRAPEVTRKRLYLETMQDVLSRNQKVMSGRGNNILYLPINTPGAAPIGGNTPDNTPMTRLPATQALLPTPAATTPADRTGRGDGRDGGR